MLASLTTTTRTRLGFGLLGVAAAVAVLALGPAAEAQTAVTVNRQFLSLEAANSVVSAALGQANSMGVNEVIVVDDRDGFLIAMARMDNARLTSINIAMDKAYTAALRQTATADLIANFTDNPAGMASFLAQPHMTLLGGGIPIMVNNTLVGGIGASGGTADQDVQIAQAGLAALQR
jgi:uncharacterized protein GlcG (DUF336 family)